MHPNLMTFPECAGAKLVAKPGQTRPAAAGDLPLLALVMKDCPKKPAAARHIRKRVRRPCGTHPLP